jgi:hypothetical protein
MNGYVKKHRILIGKPEGNKPVARPGTKRRIILK